MANERDKDKDKDKDKAGAKDLGEARRLVAMASHATDALDAVQGQSALKDLCCHGVRFQAQHVLHPYRTKMTTPALCQPLGQQ
jgi:hypothetical protein